VASGMLKRAIYIAAAITVATLAPSSVPLKGYSDPLTRFPISSPPTKFPNHLDLTRENSSLLNSPEEMIFGVTHGSPKPAAPYQPSEYDIPLELSDGVWQNLMRLQKSGGRSVRVSLERGGFYTSLMKRVLWEEGCPPDMVYLAMIESGFNPTARSRADAAGPWQFIKSTGENYNLEINEWIDERLDIDKSTRAAARHLMDLYAQFESWPLVLAAYNAGAGAVQRAIRRRVTTNFWELSEFNDFRPETKAFVPRFYASMILGKHPERFGLANLEPMEHPRPVDIRAGPLTDIAVVSKISGAPYEQLLNLNAQYLYGCTPPDDSEWKIRVPEKYALKLQEKIDSLKPEERNEFLRHKLRKGENITSLARRYRIPTKIILEANHLKSLKQAKRDMILIIPKRATGPPPHADDEPQVTQTSAGRFTVRYTVGEGDTLWKIAAKAGVEIEDVLKWNDIRKEDYIYPGQSLILHAPDAATARRVGVEGRRNRQTALNGPSALVTYHTVRSGQSISNIARKYHVTTKEIISWNNLEHPYHLHAGQKIKLYR